MGFEPWMTPKSKVPKELIEQISKVTGKRPRAVIDHILKYGYVTTAELSNLYNYDHAPRAARDVREAGIPLVTKMLVIDGKRMAAYHFGDPQSIVRDRSEGRIVFSKAFRDLVITNADGRCGVCLAKYESRYLQIDHRIPYEISGDAPEERNPNDYMPLCGECQRKKSWSCEHCINWTKHDRDMCANCYWASPEEFDHLAGKQERKVTITWTEKEIIHYEKFKASAKSQGSTIENYIKNLLK
jgi:hypothetical protein